MQTTMNCGSELKEKIIDSAVERTQAHAVTTLAAELKRLLVRCSDVLQKEGICHEMQQLEDWLETERRGPAPAFAITEGGISWLSSLRNKLKLSAEEILRLEDEGGNTGEGKRVEDLLKIIRHIDDIIAQRPVVKPHQKKGVSYVHPPFGF